MLIVVSKTLAEHKNVHNFVNADICNTMTMTGLVDFEFFT
jgi:hypothetical protein